MDRSEQEVKPSLVLRDSRGEITVFRSAADLLSWVEEVDVEGGEYTGWDSEGRAFNLSINNESGIQIEPDTTLEPDYLREVLAAYVTRIRKYRRLPLEGIASASLSELIEELAYWTVPRESAGLPRGCGELLHGATPASVECEHIDMSERRSEQGGFR